MKYSFLYIFFEALSKGGPHLFLLIISSSLSSDLYDQMMLLVALEGFLALFYLGFYTNLLFTLKNKLDSVGILNSVNTSNLIVFFILSIIVFLGQKWIIDYYNYDNIWVYLFVVINSLCFVTFRFNVVFLQIEENHKKSLIIKSTPFLVAFIFSVICTILFSDKLLGFFFGKVIGFVLSGILLKVTNVLEFNFKFKSDAVIVKEFLSRGKYLVLINFFGWLSGYGFLYFARVFWENTTVLGNMLNVFTLLLLIANGVNQVYTPKLKKVFELNKNKGLKLSYKILLVFIGISMVFAAIGFGGQFLSFGLFYDKIVSNVPFATAVFASMSLHYVFTPYFLLEDNYKSYLFYSVVSYLLAIVAVIVLGTSSVPLLYVYIIFSLLKVIVPFCYFMIKMRPNYLDNEAV
jgi:hypothetical protein